MIYCSLYLVISSHSTSLPSIAGFIVCFLYLISAQCRVSYIKTAAVNPGKICNSLRISSLYILNKSGKKPHTCLTPHFVYVEHIFILMEPVGCHYRFLIILMIFSRKCQCYSAAQTHFGGELCQTTLCSLQNTGAYRYAFVLYLSRKILSIISVWSDLFY